MVYVKACYSNNKTCFICNMKPSIIYKLMNSANYYFIYVNLSYKFKGDKYNKIFCQIKHAL